MKYKIVYSKEYQKAIKKLSQNDLRLVEEVLEKLANGKTLEARHKDHKLKGSLKGLRECHIKPDLLLIYDKKEELLILKAISIGTHSEIF